MWGLLLGLGAVLLVLTVMGRPAAAGLGALSEAINQLISFSFEPTIKPTIGLEFTPGVWEWWRSASAFFERGGFQIGVEQFLPGPNDTGGDTTGGTDTGLGGVPVVPIVSPTISQIQEWLGII